MRACCTGWEEIEPPRAVLFFLPTVAPWLATLAAGSPTPSPGGCCGGWPGGGSGGKGRNPRSGTEPIAHSALLAGRCHCFRFGLLAAEDAGNAAHDPPQ